MMQWIRSFNRAAERFGQRFSDRQMRTLALAVAALYFWLLDKVPSGVTAALLGFWMTLLVMSFTRRGPRRS
ncbi:hypothetical protein [Pseudomonas sp.]|uniref:hypothetical protein n=1 Tax=Pseudomonas sp. TaxID=306 RepID=UPI0028ACDD5F|nr:hypothetical protein [Pseudomonas sp.]